MALSTMASLRLYGSLVAFSLWMLNMGCAPAPTTPHDHGPAKGPASSEEHHHDEARESLTLWTNDLEVYVEYPMLVAGSPHEILLHLTHIDTGLPVRNAPVSYRALPAAGDTPVEGQAHGLRPGVYAAAPVFPRAGDWHMELQVALGPEPTLVSLHEMDVHEKGEMHAHHDAEPLSGAITFLKEQQWVVPVTTAAVRIDTIVERHRIPAVVLVSPHTQRSVVAPTSGTVAPLDSGMFPALGNFVETGQTLARILPSRLGGEFLAWESNRQALQGMRADLSLQAAQASGEASRIRALLAQQEAALERTRRLWEARAGARRDLDAMQGAVAETRAALAAAEHSAAVAHRALADLPSPDAAEEAGNSPVVQAPISGRISRLHAGPGSRLDAGQPLLDVINTEQVLIEGRVPELLAAKLAQPLSGRFEIPGLPGTLFDIQTPKDAQAPWMPPYVDENTRTVPVVFPAANPEGRLLLGMQLTLWMDGQEAREALVAPASAVIDEHGIPVVYVMVQGELFERRPVRLGLTSGNQVEIMEGVHAGERVVSQGGYAIRLAGMANSFVGSAHVH